MKEIRTILFRKADCEVIDEDGLVAIDYEVVLNEIKNFIGQINTEVTQ